MTLKNPNISNKFQERTIVLIKIFGIIVGALRLVLATINHLDDK